MYAVNCDECKADIRQTEDVRESYAGGHCDARRAKNQTIAKSQVKR